MKKLMFFAMAAMVALASCSKTELVDNSAPAPIGFKAVTGSITKAVQTSNSFTQDLGVIAYKSGETGENGIYFNNTQFTGNITDGYKNNDKFWPITSALDFFVYSPYQGSNVSNLVTSTSEQSLEVTIGDNTPTNTNGVYEQTDYLYSDVYITNKSKANSSQNGVSVNLKHALSMITVEFDNTGDGVFNSAVLNGTYQAGKYTVSYTQNGSNIEWSSQSTQADLQLMANDQVVNNATYMVVPSDATSITVTYTMNGSDGSPISYNVDLTSYKWEPGTHHTYILKIEGALIKFIPNVTDWDIENANSETIN